MDLSYFVSQDISCLLYTVYELPYPVFCFFLFVFLPFFLVFFKILEVMTHVSSNDVKGWDHFPADAADKHHMTLQNQ